MIYKKEKKPYQSIIFHSFSLHFIIIIVVFFVFLSVNTTYAVVSIRWNRRKRGKSGYIKVSMLAMLLCGMFAYVCACMLCTFPSRLHCDQFLIALTLHTHTYMYVFRKLHT